MPTRHGSRLPSFIAIVLAVLATCWAIAGALFAPVLPHGWASVVVLAIVFTFGPFAALIASRLRHARPPALVRVLVFRTFWYAQLLLLVVAPVGLAAAVLGALAGWSAGVPRIVVAVVGAVALGMAAAGYAGSRRLVVTRIAIAIPELPAALDGLRMVQLTDLHVGPHTSRRFLARVAAGVRCAEPELIAITGDLIDDHPADVDDFAAALGGLSAPLGVYVVPGNHDVYAGWPRVAARLSGLPFTLLVNDARVVMRHGAPLAIIGTGDPAGRMGGDAAGAAPDIAAAIDGAPPAAFTIALAHNPALWPLLAARGVPLTLSGHTHWGQLALPGREWSLAGVFLELAMGAYRRGISTLYIHPGTNYWGIPFRLGTPPEVAVITLHRGTSVDTAGEWYVRNSVRAPSGGVKGAREE